MPDLTVGLVVRYEYLWHRRSRAADTADKDHPACVVGAKVKFDRRIICIAKAYNVAEIHSDDEHVEKLGESLGLTVVGLLVCPLPPDLRQPDLPTPKEINSGNETTFKLS